MGVAEELGCISTDTISPSRTLPGNLNRTLRLAHRAGGGSAGIGDAGSAIRIGESLPHPRPEEAGHD